MNAVGSHDQVEGRARPGGEVRLDAVAAIDEVRQAVREMDPLGRQGAGQHRQQIGAMDLVVREAKGGLDPVAQRGAQQCPAIFPATLVPGQRTHARPGQAVGEAEPVEHARRIGTDLDAGSNLSQRRCLLVDVDVEARAQQRQRRGQTADPAADHCDRWHRTSVAVDRRDRIAPFGRVSRPSS
jgi:hypothetical protein